jgi:hypothetical protein
MDTLTESARKLLHSPNAAEHHNTLEEHLNIAARLARALWEMTSSDALDTQDERDLDALRELASMVAEHASLARFVYFKETQARRTALMGGVQ